jgi:glycosyltransferase involved in cell wall biosynthesis
MSVTGIRIEPSGGADLPLVTVVTPSYNQGRFIAATIESVLSQDYPNVEYVIVDGASTDDTAEVVARYAGRLTYVSEPDSGQSDAINKGFRRARGEYVAWLNSDDVFLPGAISAAVAALRAHPGAGAVYGDGFQIDEAGNVISRFAVTQQFNLWKLLNLSDYILQQTVFFRRSVFDDVGLLDETLHYGLDWEILMRIGLRYPLVYVPHDMGAIREYPAAKSFMGGAKRARELTAIMRRHTRKRFPPGMFVYGMPSFVTAVNARIAWVFRGPLARFGARLQRRVAWIGDRLVGEILRHAQGWYSDGWASAHAEFTFRPGAGRFLAMDVALPPWAPIERQRITFSVGGRAFAWESFARGEFRIPVMLPRDTWDAPVTVHVRAETFFRPGDDVHGRRDRRKLAYLLRSFDYED